MSERKDPKAVYILRTRSDARTTGGRWAPPHFDIYVSWLEAPISSFNLVKMTRRTLPWGEGSVTWADYTYRENWTYIPESMHWEEQGKGKPWKRK